MSPTDGDQGDAEPFDAMLVLQAEDGEVGREFQHVEGLGVPDGLVAADGHPDAPRGEVGPPGLVQPHRASAREPEEPGQRRVGDRLGRLGPRQGRATPPPPRPDPPALGRHRPPRRGRGRRPVPSPSPPPPPGRRRRRPRRERATRPPGKRRRGRPRGQAPSPAPVAACGRRRSRTPSPRRRGGTRPRRSPGRGDAFSCHLIHKPPEAVGVNLRIGPGCRPPSS